jgi:hypothetical protein
VGSAGLKRGPPSPRRLRFLYQLTHITKDRGSLTHDDRVDAVAGAVAHFQRAMMMDVDQAAKAMRDEEMLAEIEDFLEGFNQPTAHLPRDADQRPAGRYVVLPARVVRGWPTGRGVAGALETLS